MIGKTLGTRFLIEEQIGSGAMGTVYRARDTLLERIVAVKVVAPTLVQPEQRARFLREARALASLAHPNIVTIFDFGYENEFPYLVMEHLTGASLRARCGDSATPREVATWAVQTCEALACAHGNGIVHRDLKPENIYLTESGVVKLMDFGLARMLNAAQLSQIGAMVGTCHYMSPEQIKGESVDGAADLYALGVILYELVAGRRPFEGAEIAAVITQILFEAPPPPSQFRAVPPLLEAVILRLLEKDPTHRFSSATMVRQALINMDPGSEVAPPRETPPASLNVAPLTFLFTDIEGSSQLWEQATEAMGPTLERHDGIMRAAIASYHGKVFKTGGDSFHASFERATDAVACAAELQRKLAAEQWQVPLRVRMGLHTGEAEARSGDYFGDAVNRVARLVELAHGGQILLSQVTMQLVTHRLPTDATLRDLGKHMLRGLEREEQVFELRLPNTPDFPPLRSQPQYQHNLPAELTSFIGREREVTELRALLAKTRLLTLTGAGGCGKTRLSLRLAAQVLDYYPDGVWQVELAALSDPSLVWQSVALALRVKEERDLPLREAVLSHVKERKLLLVLDNCEHLVAACAAVVVELLHRAPGLTVLATSRATLGVAGEMAWRVPSLAAPKPDELPKDPAQVVPSVLQFDAVRLFFERAQLAKMSFQLTPTNAATIARICHTLDGIPLAIELAAARVKLLSIDQIAERLKDRFRLVGGGSGPTSRHNTLRECIAWSYDLLEEAERALLRRLSVFAGGWTLEAAEAICVGDSVDEASALDLLSNLVDQSLVDAQETESGETRHTMLQTVRDYAIERLDEAGEASEVRTRHLSWFLQLAEEAEPKLTGAEQAEWLDRLEREHDNIRTALSFSRGKAMLRLASAIHRFWFVRGHLSEGRAWLESALTGEDDATLRAKALNAAGILTWAQADYEAAARFYRSSLDLRRQLGDVEGVARAYNNLAIVACCRHDFRSARAHYEESLAIYRELDNRKQVATVLGNMATIPLDQGDFAAAIPLLEEALVIQRELEDQGGIAISLHNLGEATFHQGEFQRARMFLSESLGLQRELMDRRCIIGSMTYMAMLAAETGDAVRAAYLFGAAEGERRKVGAAAIVANHAAYEKSVAATRVALDNETFKSSWTNGEAMTTLQAIDCALDESCCISVIDV